MSLRDQFDQITPQTIVDYVAQAREEDLHLDFKVVNDANLTRDDRKSLAVALSGFANSDGGLIVWGVDARQNAQGIDAAQARRDISNLPLLLGRLNELSGQSVSPLVDGVLHRIIPVAGNDGFAVTLVPVSDSGPHMAKGGEDRYYKRSGSAFYRMEHFDIEDMFGRRRKPVLIVTAQPHPRVTSSAGGAMHYQGIVVVSIENRGRGFARAPYLAVSPTRPYVVDGNGIGGREGLPRLISVGGAFTRYGSGSDQVVHPGTQIDICAIRFETQVDQQRRIIEPPPLEIRYQVSAEGMRLTEAVFNMTPYEMMAAVLPPEVLAKKREAK
jgi:hypothetical protein